MSSNVDSNTNNKNYDPNYDDPNGLAITPPVIPVTLPTPTTDTQSTQSVSSIQKSTTEHQQDPAVIALMPPMLSQTDLGLILQNNFLTGGIGASMGNAKLADSISAAYDQANTQAVTSLLNGWINNIQEIEQQRKVEERSPAAIAVTDYKSRLEKGDPSAVGAAPVMASMLILATMFAAGVGGPELVQATVSAASNTIEGAVQAVVSVMPSLATMSAELGLIGALFATAAMHPALMATIMQGTGGSTVNAAFAKNFAEQVIRTVQDQNMTSSVIASLFGNRIDAGLMTKERAQQLISIVKLALLFNALALMTKVETGHLTAEELTAMVTGEITFSAGDPRTTIIDLIRQQLAVLTNVVERRKLIESLLSYFDSNPNVEKLADPANSISAMFDSSSNSEASINQTI